MLKIRTILNYHFAKELQTFRRIDYIFLYKLYCLKYKMDEHQILILSESREQLSGNLEFIDRKIDKNLFKVKYFLKKSIIEKRSFSEKKKLCKELAISKYILVDDFIPFMYPIPLRKETKFIQVWHAMGAFKKVGFSRLGKVGGPSPRSLTHKNYTDTIVSSGKIKHNYAEAFGITEDKVHAIGIPRTDIFFDENYKSFMVSKLLSKYPQLKNKQVILFAPTFRGNGVKTAFYDYSWINFEKLEELLGDEYIFIVKMHPFIKERPMEKLKSNFFLDLSDEREINDLLFVSDILITDYSSVIFEASLLNLKTIFFAPDIDEYMRDRDFYYPYDEYTFGPVAKDLKQLIYAIKEEKNDNVKLNEFKEKFCGSCDGKSTERFVKFFFGEGEVDDDR